MSNEEITKALGLCFNINDNAGLNCGECPYKERTECSLNLYSDTIDLINRQQAEIDRLKAEHEKTTVYCANLFDKYEKTKIAKESLENTRYTARAEAIKEFAKRLKEFKYLQYEGEVVSVRCIDDIAEEIERLFKYKGGADNG